MECDIESNEEDSQLWNKPKKITQENMVLNTQFESYKSDSIVETCQKLRNTKVENVFKSIFGDARFWFLLCFL